MCWSRKMDVDVVESGFIRTCFPGHPCLERDFRSFNGPAGVRWFTDGVFRWEERRKIVIAGDVGGPDHL